MNLISIGAGWAAALNICIGVLAAVTGWKRPGHAPFAALCAALGIWNFGFALAYPQYGDCPALRLMYFGVVFVAPISLHFVLDFTGDRRLRLRRILYSGYAISVLLTVCVIVAGVLSGHFPPLSLVALLPMPLALYAWSGAVRHGAAIGGYPHYLGANVAVVMLTTLLLGVSLILG